MCVVGDVFVVGINYFIVGVVVIVLVGIVFFIFFFWKDFCLECDGVGFVRKIDFVLNVNVVRKD